MKIAGVSVNIENLPSKETILEKALRTSKYIRMDKKIATKDINNQINESGLFKKVSTTTRKQDIESGEPTR